MRSLIELPAVQLHVHLESTIRPETLVEIGAGNGVAVPDEVARGPFAFTGFRAFADHNALVRGCLRRAADFERIALEFCEDEAARGTVYAEATFTAASHGERVGDMEMPLAAVVEGLRRGRERYGVEVRLILDHSRRRSVERARVTVELAARYPRWVVAVGLAGDDSYPAEPFAQVFAGARESGLAVVHHAGECAGPASVWSALRGGAVRIGHGITVLSDRELVARLRDLRVPLEVCPSSNVALGLVPLERHPLPRLVAAGLAVTVNTDVPNVTGTSMAAEFAVARSVFGLDDTVLASMAETSVVASFAPEPVKARLLAGVAAWLRRPPGGSPAVFVERDARVGVVEGRCSR